jgi:hypothetical protein
MTIRLGLGALRLFKKDQVYALDLLKQAEVHLSYLKNKG